MLGGSLPVFWSIFHGNLLKWQKEWGICSVLKNTCFTTSNVGMTLTVENSPEVQPWLVRIGQSCRVVTWTHPDNNYINANHNSWELSQNDYTSCSISYFLFLFYLLEIIKALTRVQTPYSSSWLKQRHLKNRITSVAGKQAFTWFVILCYKTSPTIYHESTLITKWCVLSVSRFKNLCFNASNCTRNIPKLKRMKYFRTFNFG